MAHTTVRLTPLAALIDAELRRQKSIDLPTFIAARRVPGQDWLPYDAIAFELEAVVQRPLNRVSIRTYAEETFKIPDTRYAQVGGRTVSMPRAVTMQHVEDYVNALNPLIIDVELVRRVGQAQVRQNLEALAADLHEDVETAAILADPQTMAAIRAGEQELAGDNPERTS